MKISVPLALCLFGSIAFIALLLFYSLKICSLKKSLGEKAPQKDGKLVPAVVVSGVAALLPYIIPMETWVIALVCACSVLALAVVMRERIEVLKKESDSEEKTKGNS